MKIATWNINSVRARIDRLLAWLKIHQPDVLCLQELKCTEDQFPFLELQAAGYRAQVFGQKTYNGVALLSVKPLENVWRGLADGADDPQARLIGGTLDGVHVVTSYLPNGQSVGSEAFEYKLTFFKRLQRFLGTKFTAEVPLVVCGDFNVAPEEIDVWDPRVFQGQTLFTDTERRAWRELQASLQLVDVFRVKNPGPGHFSWFDYRMSGFKKKRGLRIDHLLVTAKLAARCTDSQIDTQARDPALPGPEIPPSDHAPVWATFDTSAPL